LQGTLKTVSPAASVPDDDTPSPIEVTSSTPGVHIEINVTVQRGRGPSLETASTPIEVPGTLTIEPSAGGEALTVPVVEASARRLRGLAHSLLLANGVDDDRYLSPSPAEDGWVETDSVTVGAALLAAGQIAASISGSPSRGRLQLDVMARWPDWPADPPDRVPNRIDVATALVDRCLRLAAQAPGSDRWQPEIWGKPEQPWHEALARRLTLISHRALHQLRCPLPATSPPSGLPTRDLDPVEDLDAMLAVNNRAFATHPDQGGRERSYLEAAFTDSDFDPTDVRIAVDHDSGRMIGFCWTKLHPPAPNRPETAGEIYVVGIDPDFQGRGLGVPLTAAGLHHLHQRGATLGMLYVEADNEPALNTYRKLGFTVHRTDRAWRRE
jgi:mycothiol synthase